MRQTGTMSRGVPLRCQFGSSVLVCPWWLGLGPEVYSGLKATVTLLGAGTLGAYIMLKCAPKLLAGRSPTPTLKNEATGSVPFEQVLTVRGLQNTGNSCFLNVILQALASSEVLLNFMDACAALTTDTKCEAQAKGMTGKVSMPLAIAVSSLIKDLSQLESLQCTSSPRGVMLALSLYVQHFDLDSQQDAAEALIHLASALQEERCKYLEWLRPTLQSFVKAPLIYGSVNFSMGRRNNSSMNGGDQLLDSWRGHLPWPLEGTIASSLACQRCGYQFSTQFQSFNDIALTPVCDREGNMIRGCSLESCLDHFTRPEWVDSVKCSNCSHKAALLSILLNSGESVLTSVTGGRTGNHKVSRSKVKFIEECGCDEDCKCEVLTGEEGGVWRNIYTNASKHLKIGRSPQYALVTFFRCGGFRMRTRWKGFLPALDCRVQMSASRVVINEIDEILLASKSVICFQVQRAVMSHEGAMKKFTGHVTFPRVLDLFPYTVAAKDCLPLKEYCSNSNDRESSFTKEMRSRSFHPSYGTDGVFENKPPLHHTEVRCKGGAELDLPAPESRETMFSDWKEGSRGENRAVEAEAECEKMGSTFIPISATVSELDPFDKEETGSENLATETVMEAEPGSTRVEEATLPSVAINLAVQDVLQKSDRPIDNSSTYITGAQVPTNEEATAQCIRRTLLEQTSSSDRILVDKQIPNADCGLVEETVQPVRTSSPQNGGYRSPASSIVQSIYSPYTPRVVPPIFQQLTSFATPYEDQQLSAGIHGNVKMLPGLHSLSKKSTRLMPRKPKYSRNLLYQLISVVVHQGGPQNGHYLVYRKVRIRGSKRDPTNEDLVWQRDSVDDEGLGDKRNINLAHSTSVLGESAVKVLAAEAGKTRSEVCHLFRVESLPDTTYGKRMEFSRSRVNFSEGQEQLKCELPHDPSLADNVQAQRMSGTLLEECTSCTEICGRLEDANSLWFRISDTNVQSVQEEEVFNAQASLLFYEQL